MVNLYLDPYIFACPQVTDLAEFQAYISRLMGWQGLRDVSWANVYVSSSAYDVLSATNAYPPWEDVKSAIVRLGIQEEVQPQDVVGLVNSLLSRLSPLEDILHLKDILFDNVNCEPKYYVGDRASEFVRGLEHLLVLACVVGQLEDCEASDQFVITRNLTDDIVPLAVDVEAIEYEFQPEAQVQEMPPSVNCTLLACESPEALYGSLDPVMLWLDAANAEMYSAALDIYVQQHIGTIGLIRELTGQTRWTFGNNFLHSAQALGFRNEETKAKMLLRACSETVIRLNMDATHKLRAGSGAEEPQRTRGRDKAWRRDIDHTYHLHYWETEHGIEFARVVVHDDMEI